MYKRQEFFKQYYNFECRCIPCSFNWPLQREIKTSVAKRGMGSKANEIKMAYANVNKLTMHDTQVTYFRKRRLDFITTIIFMKKLLDII